MKICEYAPYTLARTTHHLKDTNKIISWEQHCLELLFGNNCKWKRKRKATNKYNNNAIKMDENDGATAYLDDNRLKCRKFIWWRLLNHTRRINSDLNRINESQVKWRRTSVFICPLCNSLVVQITYYCNSFFFVFFFLSFVVLLLTNGNPTKNLYLWMFRVIRIQIHDWNIEKEKNETEFAEGNKKKRPNTMLKWNSLSILCFKFSSSSSVRSFIVNGIDFFFLSSRSLVIVCAL